MRDAALRLQQLLLLHAGACAAARLEYRAAPANTALLAHLSQQLDRIHAGAYQFYYSVYHSVSLLY